MHYLGNDVVDLHEAHNRRSAANPRFAARILTAAERQPLGLLAQHSQSAHLRGRWLWACWSAKEAAYKALSRQRPGLPFIHRQFHVSMDAGSAARLRCDAGNGTASGTVRFREIRVPVIWQWTTEWIHCLGGSTQATYRVGLVNQRADEGMSQESCAVRTLASRLLDHAGIHHARIDRTRTATGRPGAPCVTRNGTAVPGCTVSLSHDGRFVAAAVATAAREVA